jgi:MFS family permease
MAASDVLMASSAERTPSFKRAKSKIVLGEEEFGVGHHIDKIGFGWYQAEAFLFCAGALWCESINLSSIAGIKEPIYKEFHITSDLGQSLLVTLLYSGFTIGTAAAGSVGDTKGRRVPIMVGFMGMALSQVLLFYVPNLAGLYILVFVLGCCAGFPIPAAVTMMGEVVPSHFRGLTVGALALGLSMGELTSAIGLRLFVPNLVDGAWRFQLLWAAIPPVFLLLMGLFCSATAFDSPQFLASHNRQKELRGALNLMAEMNGRPDFVLDHDLPGDEGESDVSFAEARDVLFSGKMAMYTLALCVMFFTFNWGYYGTVDFWPLGWEGMHLQGIDKATEMIFTALIGFIGVPVAMFTMHSVPRRPGICVAALFCFIASVCLHGLLVDSIVKGWVGVVLFKIFWMTFQMTSCLLPSEIYPTRISVWGFSIVCFFGRLGCIMAPIAISFSSSVFLNALAVLLLATASMVWILPETSDVDLEALDNPMLVDKLGASGSVYGSCVPSFSASPA